MAKMYLFGRGVNNFHSIYYPVYMYLKTYFNISPIYIPEKLIEWNFTPRKCFYGFSSLCYLPFFGGCGGGGGGQ